MADVLPALIDKQDGFEVVRDQIGLILVENQAEQQVLATAAAEDPALWELRVFIERTNPWELFLNEIEQNPSTANLSPIVNIFYESGTFDQSKGDPVQSQAHAGIFNIDVVGWGVAHEDPPGSQVPGDLDAALTTQRGVRLVRNILMAAQNTYLQLQKKQVPLGPGVWQRWVQSISSFQPELQNESSHQLLGMRIAFRVEFGEIAQQHEGVDLELITVDIHRDSDGMLIAEADYDVT